MLEPNCYVKDCGTARQNCYVKDCGTTRQNKGIGIF